MLLIAINTMLSGLWLVFWRLNHPEHPYLSVGVTRNLSIILNQIVLGKMLFDMFNDRYNINIQFKAEQKQNADKIAALEERINVLKHAARGDEGHIADLQRHSRSDAVQIDDLKQERGPASEMITATITTITPTSVEGKEST